MRAQPNIQFVRQSQRRNGAYIHGTDYWFQVSIEGGEEPLEVPVKITDSAKATAVPEIGRDLQPQDFVRIAEYRLRDQIAAGFRPKAAMPLNEMDAILTIDSGVLQSIAFQALKRPT